MTPVVLLNHFLNFLAPALWLAILLPLAGRFFLKSRVSRPGFWVQAAVHLVVNLLVLVIGLWSFGRDGKMATYAGMTAACATSQWLMLRGWRA